MTLTPDDYARAEAIAAIEHARTSLTLATRALARQALDDPDHPGTFYANELTKTARTLTTEARRITRIERA